jgi:glycosyltransferase involved in cell wall biosynthesis
MVLPRPFAGRGGPSASRATDGAGAAVFGAAALLSHDCGRAIQVSHMKVALVHEWLTTYAGSEKVLEIMLSEFPDADIFCLIDCLPQQHRAGLQGRRPKTTFLQKIPFIRHMYRFALAAMPIAIEQLDLSGYDVIISNCHAVAKGVITGPDQLHICYCYSPMRYAWDLQAQYLAESGLRYGLRSMIARWQLHRIRTWDCRAAQNVDHFIACSGYIGRRIRKAYHRDATVIYPNVDVDAFVIGDRKEDFYLTSSRMVPYKKMHLIVEAFAAMPDRRLIVIGDGPQFRRCKALAAPNVTLLGYQPHDVLLQHMQRARAFLFAAEEDFGITPVEAQACGTPVIAYGRGGASETVIDGVTGMLFHEQSAAAIRDAVHAFERVEANFDPTAIRAHSLRFSTERFRREFSLYVGTRWQAHVARLRQSERPSPLAAPAPSPLAAPAVPAGSPVPESPTICQDAIVA